MMLSLFCIGDNFGGMVMSHKPSFLFLIPLIITSLFFIIFNVFFLNIAVQSSSHSCPIDIKDELERFGYIVAFVAVFDNVLIGIYPE